MSEPWFVPENFWAWYGAIAGGVGGTLGGMLGGLAGSLAPRGVGRSFVLGSMYVMLALGVAQLALALYAILVGQPYGTWAGPLTCGVLYCIVFGGLIPVIYHRYREAETRILEAEAMRKS